MEFNQYLPLPSLGLPGVGQLGFIVHDMQRSLPGIAATFDLSAWFKPRYSEKRFVIDGQEIELEFNPVFSYSGNLQIELIEEKSRRVNIYQGHLDEYGESLHHLGFFVPDLDAKLKLAEQSGLKPLFLGEFNTAGGGFVRFAYLDTREQCGLIVELIAIKLYGVNVPQTEFMMNVARLTGDVEKFSPQLAGDDNLSP
jgi:hypothetical protein